MCRNCFPLSMPLTVFMLGCLEFCWPVKKCEFPTVMVGVLLLADITKVPKLPIVVSVTSLLPHLFGL